MTNYNTILDMNNPDLSVDLSSINDAGEIQNKFKRYGIRSEFVYEISYIDPNTNEIIIIKYGQSANTSIHPNSNNPRYGERVYRQIAHIPGWSNTYCNPAAGVEMIGIIKKLQHTHHVHKNNCQVKAWNLDHLRNKFKNKRLVAEDYAIREHRRSHNDERPIGNKTGGNPSQADKSDELIEFG